MHRPSLLDPTSLVPSVSSSTSRLPPMDELDLSGIQPLEALDGSDEIDVSLATPSPITLLGVEDLEPEARMDTRVVTGLATTSRSGLAASDTSVLGDADELDELLDLDEAQALAMVADDVSEGRETMDVDHLDHVENVDEDGDVEGPLEAFDSGDLRLMNDPSVLRDTDEVSEIRSIRDLGRGAEASALDDVDESDALDAQEAIGEIDEIETSGLSHETREVKESRDRNELGDADEIAEDSACEREETRDLRTMSLSREFRDITAPTDPDDVDSMNDEVSELDLETRPIERRFSADDVAADAQTMPLHLLDMADVVDVAEVADVEDLYVGDDLSTYRLSLAPPDPEAFTTLPPPPPSRPDFTSLSPFAIDGETRMSLAPVEPPVRRSTRWTMSAMVACAVMLGSTASFLMGHAHRGATASLALSPISNPVVLSPVLPSLALEASPEDDMAIVVDVAPQIIRLGEDREEREARARGDVNASSAMSTTLDSTAATPDSKGESRVEEASSASDAPAVELADFDASRAQSALGAATASASSCNDVKGPSGTARVSITFAPSGRVTQASIEGPPFSGTSVGSCIASRFRAASVPAFRGGAVTVRRTVEIR